MMIPSYLLSTTLYSQAHSETFGNIRSDYSIANYKTREVPQLKNARWVDRNETINNVDSDNECIKVSCKVYDLLMVLFVLNCY